MKYLKGGERGKGMSGLSSVITVCRLTEIIWTLGIPDIFVLNAA